MLSTAFKIQIGDCIGKGAFGTVHRGLNVESGEVLAIKRIPIVDMQKTELDLIMMEIDLLKELKHPNIVKYMGFTENEGSLSIMMEYCENGSLNNIRKKFGKFPESLASRYMQQVLLGLSYLHDQGVIHRDLKCANILTTKDGHIKLADFGVATRIVDITSKNVKNVVGSPYWMAPEIIELQGATPASDIWSVGCTAIELIQGNPPYHELTAMSALFRIVTDDRPPLPEFITSQFCDFLLQCFQKDPSLRVSSKRLLNHPWFQQLGTSSKNSSSKSKWLEVAETSDQNWDGDFDGELKAFKLGASCENHQGNLLKVSNQQECWDEDFDFKDNTLSSFNSIARSVKQDTSKQMKPLLFWSEEGEDWSESFEGNYDKTFALRQPNEDFCIDPFADEGILDPECAEKDNRTKISANLENLMGLLKPAACSSDLICATQKIFQLIKENSCIKKTLLTHHYVVLFVETLAVVEDQLVRYNILKLLNELITENSDLLETLCLLGVIPTVMSLAENLDLEIRFEVAKFCLSLTKSGKSTLEMFICCRGLSTLAHLIDKSNFARLEVVLLAVEGLHTVFELKNIARNDFCLILNQHKGILRLSQALSFLSNKQQSRSLGIDAAIAHISNMMLTFSMASDVHTKEVLAKDCSKFLLSSLTKIPEGEASSLLHCFKNVSNQSNTLEFLQKSNFIPLIPIVAKQFSNSNDIQTQIIHTLFNMCRLSPIRQTIAAECGLLFYLQSFVRTECRSRHFAIQILCEMSHAGIDRVFFWKAGVLETYLRLVGDKFWRANALEAIAAWLNEDSAKVGSELLKRRADLKILFETVISSKDDSLFKILGPIHKMLSKSSVLCDAFLTNHQFIVGLSAKLLTADSHSKILVLDILLRFKARLKHIRLEERFKNTAALSFESNITSNAFFLESPVFIENVNLAQKLAREELVRQKTKQLLNQI